MRNIIFGGHKILWVKLKAKLLCSDKKKKKHYVDAHFF